MPLLFWFEREWEPLAELVRQLRGYGYDLDDLLHYTKTELETLLYNAQCMERRLLFYRHLYVTGQLNEGITENGSA